MRPTGGLVHEGGPNGPIIIALVHFPLNHLVAVDGVFAQPLHINRSTWRFSDLEPTLWLLFWVDDEEILDLLVINLEHGELNLILNGLIFLRAGIDSSENFVTGDRYNTFIASIANLY